MSPVEPTNSLATIHQQPSHQPETDNRPSSTEQHLQPTNPLATHSQQPTHWPKSDNQPTAASTRQPQPFFSSSLLTGLRLKTLVSNSTPHLYRSSIHQRLIWILTLTQIMTLVTNIYIPICMHLWTQPSTGRPMGAF